MDILLNNDFTPQLSGGDFRIGDDKNQIVGVLLKANPGDFRQWPTMGIGLEKHLNGSEFARLKNDFNSQVRQIEGLDSEIRIGANGSVAVVV